APSEQLGRFEDRRADFPVTVSPAQFPRGPFRALPERRACRQNILRARRSLERHAITPFVENSNFASSIKKAPVPPGTRASAPVVPPVFRTRRPAGPRRPRARHTRPLVRRITPGRVPHYLGPAVRPRSVRTDISGRSFVRSSPGGLQPRPPSLRMRFRSTLSRHRFSPCQSLLLIVICAFFPVNRGRRPV